MENTNKISGICFGGYGAHYKYDNAYDCDDSCFQDICRCSTIINTNVYKVDISDIVDKIYEEIFDNTKSISRNGIINSLLYGIDDLDKYLIDRILTIYKVWDNNNWDIEITNGYYGEEIGDVKLKENIADKIEDDIINITSLGSLNEKIEFLLKKEYGYILTELENLNYKLIKIQKNDIIITNKQQLDLVNSKDLEYYLDKNYNKIRGIVTKKGDKYRLIDGYHRITSTDNQYVSVLLAF
jgi:hypothetical protein